VNRFEVQVFHSFSCVLTVRVASGKNGTRVFPLDLVKKHRGWRISADKG